MATYDKPTVVPNWATTSLNVSEPLAGKRNIGWLFEEIPPSDWENWLRRTTGEWLEWINERWQDGATADEIVLVDPDAAGAIAKWSAAACSWISSAGVEFVCEPGVVTAGRSKVNGINLKGIGTVKSIEFLEENVSIKWDEDFTTLSFHVGSSLNPVLVLSDTTISAKKPIVVDANEDITVSGTGRLRHGARKICFAASTCIPGAGIQKNIASGYTTITAIDTHCVIPLALEVGKTISQIDYFAFGGDATDRHYQLLYRADASGTAVTLTDAVDDNTAGVHTVTDPLEVAAVPAPQLVQAGRQYFARMISSGGSTTDRLSHVEVTYTD